MNPPVFETNAGSLYPVKEDPSIVSCAKNCKDMVTPYL